MNNRTGETDVVIAGGGLAGMAAANYLAREGLKVTLFEKSRALGGRAITETKNGFHFNLGPHALYRGGPAARILRELGIEYSGGIPPVSGGYVIDRGCKYALPGGMFSLMTTGLFNLSAKLGTARLLAGIGRMDARAVQSMTVREWLEREIRHPDVRRLVGSLFRLSTYADDPDRQSAGSALAQLQMAVSTGVRYLDGGWQTLVDRLRLAAENSGVKIVTGAKVESVESDGRVRGVRLNGGSFCPAPFVIAAAGPADARELVGKSRETPVAEWADSAIPVKAACLDLALKRLPQPRANFALGIDRPLYFSVHSAVAKLASGDGAVIHVAKYLGGEPDDDARVVERELEELVDLLQPGWRDQLVERRFLPNMTVSHALVTAAQDGTGGRPGPEVPGIPGLFVAGDWVGPSGILADAALASAEAAARMIVAEWNVKALAA